MAMSPAGFRSVFLNEFSESTDEEIEVSIQRANIVYPARHIPEDFRDFVGYHLVAHYLDSLKSINSQHQVSARAAGKGSESLVTDDDYGGFEATRYGQQYKDFVLNYRGNGATVVAGGTNIPFTMAEFIQANTQAPPVDPGGGDPVVPPDMEYYVFTSNDPMTSLAEIEGNTLHDDLPLLLPIEGTDQYLHIAHKTGIRSVAIVFLDQDTIPATIPTIPTNDLANRYRGNDVEHGEFNVFSFNINADRNELESGEQLGVIVED